MVRAKIVFTDDLGQSVESEVNLLGSLERANLDSIESLVIEMKEQLLPSIEKKILEHNQQSLLKKKI